MLLELLFKISANSNFWLQRGDGGYLMEHYPKNKQDNCQNDNNLQQKIENRTTNNNKLTLAPITLQVPQAVRGSWCWLLDNRINVGNTRMPKSTQGCIHIFWTLPTFSGPRPPTKGARQQKPKTTRTAAMFGSHNF